MAKFKLDPRGMAALEKQLQDQFDVASAEANAAAAEQSTPEAKARAFAAVLRKHGIKDVDEAKIRKEFGG